MADSSRKPGALVVQERTTFVSRRLSLSVGMTGGSAGGVTLAQEAPMRISSAVMDTGSAALRLNRTKLAICEMSPPLVFWRVGAGGAAWRRRTVAAEEDGDLDLVVPVPLHLVDLKLQHAGGTHERQGYEGDQDD